MSIKSQMYRMAAFAMLAGMMSNGNPYYSGRPADTSKPYARNADLPKWNYDGHIIYAKDEATAIKYAKKRGLFREGVVPQRLS